MTYKSHKGYQVADLLCTSLLAANSLSRQGFIPSVNASRSLHVRCEDVQLFIERYVFSDCGQKEKSGQLVTDI
jgi:hypothetical protein